MHNCLCLRNYASRIQKFSVPPEATELCYKKLRTDVHVHLCCQCMIETWRQGLCHQMLFLVLYILINEFVKFVRELKRNKMISKM